MKVITLQHTHIFTKIHVVWFCVAGICSEQIVDHHYRVASTNDQLIVIIKAPIPINFDAS